MDSEEQEARRERRRSGRKGKSRGLPEGLGAIGSGPPGTRRQAQRAGYWTRPIPQTNVPNHNDQSQWPPLVHPTQSSAVSSQAPSSPGHFGSAVELHPITMVHAHRDVASWATILGGGAKKNKNKPQLAPVPASTPQQLVATPAPLPPAKAHVPGTKPHSMPDQRNVLSDHIYGSVLPPPGIHDSIVFSARPKLPIPALTPAWTLVTSPTGHGYASGFRSPGLYESIVFSARSPGPAETLTSQYNPASAFGPTPTDSITQQSQETQTNNNPIPGFGWQWPGAMLNANPPVRVHKSKAQERLPTVRVLAPIPSPAAARSEPDKLQMPNSGDSDSDEDVKSGTSDDFTLVPMDLDTDYPGEENGCGIEACQPVPAPEEQAPKVRRSISFQGYLESSQIDNQICPVLRRAAQTIDPWDPRMTPGIAAALKDAKNMESPARPTAPASPPVLVPAHASEGTTDLRTRLYIQQQTDAGSDWRVIQPPATSRWYRKKPLDTDSEDKKSARSDPSHGPKKQD